MLDFLVLVAGLLAISLPLAWLYLASPDHFPKHFAHYVVPMVVLLFTILILFYFNAYRAPASFFDGWYAWSGQKGQCPQLDGTHPVASSLLPLPNLARSVCSRLVLFDRHYSFSFSPVASGYPAAPAARVAYQVGDVGYLEPLRYTYDFRLYDAQSDLRGTFNRERNYFEEPVTKAPLFLYAGQRYTLVADQVERPTGFKGCEGSATPIELDFSCFARCDSDDDCNDHDIASTDECALPGTCLSFCRYDYGNAVSTDPSNALDRIRETPEFNECVSSLSVQLSPGGVK